MDHQRASTTRAHRDAATLGQQISSARRLLRLTQQQLAERAAVSRGTIRRLEHGDPGVSVGVVFAVWRSLGLADAVLRAADLTATDFGRAQAQRELPQRVRHG